MKKFWQKIKALFTKSDVEKTSLQKTAKVSILLGCVLLVGVIVYFAVIAPLIEAEEHPIPDLYEGEVYQNNSIYILRQYERSEIKSVEIKNENEHYKLNSYEENGSSIHLKKKKETVVVAGNVSDAPVMGLEDTRVAGNTVRKEPDIVQQKSDEPEGQIVKSPLVGTFYAAPSEDAEPFVSVGDSVKKGQTLAIVEAMKLMNEIESDFDGKVAEIYVENGQAVEYGQPLFRIV